MRKIIRLFLTTIGLISISVTSIVAIVSCINNENQTKNNSIKPVSKNPISDSNKVNKSQEANEKFVILYSNLNKNVIKNAKTNEPYDDYDLAFVQWRKIYHELISN